MKKIIIDSIEYEAPDQTAQAVNKALKDAGESVSKAEQKAKDAEEAAEKEKKEKEKMETDHKAQLDTMQAKVDDAEANKVTPELLDALVVKRTGVIAVAAKVIKNFDAAGKDCDAIRKEVVTASDADLDLADKSDDYVLARFDAIAKNVADGKSTNMADHMQKPCI